MRLRWSRAIAYGVVALLGVSAVLFTNPLPQNATRSAGEILTLSTAPPLEPQWRDYHDTVGQGESLARVLARGGVSELFVREAISAAKMILDPRRIPAGMPIRVRTSMQDTVPNEIVLTLALDRFLHIKRTDSTWAVNEERLPWKSDTVVVSGVIKTNLYEAIDSAAIGALPWDARRDLTWKLATIYEYRVDMSRDLQVGDTFRVLAERNVGPKGAVRMGRVIAATMRLSGKTTEAVRFKSDRVSGDFFDATGKSLRTGFLRNPVEFRRISSGFGLRRHPILGVMKKHQGTDFAAAAGTPIRAVGDGVVIRAGWNGGYGNVVDIRHPNGFVTRYGHMLRFASGVYAGARVSIEQTIGYVGSTGLSTAPHLHFEVLVHGVPSPPKVALGTGASAPLPSSERVVFADVRTRLLALLESPALVASAESAVVKQAGVTQH
jgi:murein DD-endopeptidase MepM/ murein hydrolase activator NlpD